VRECPGQLRHSSVAGGLVVSMGPPEFGVHGPTPTMDARRFVLRASRLLGHSGFCWFGVNELSLIAHNGPSYITPSTPFTNACSSFQHRKL
jgi:hypothetical protein